MFWQGTVSDTQRVSIAIRFQRVCSCGYCKGVRRQEVAGCNKATIGPLRDNYHVSEVKLDGLRVTNGILDIPKNTASELIFTLNQGGQIEGPVVVRNCRR